MLLQNPSILYLEALFCLIDYFIINKENSVFLGIHAITYIVWSFIILTIEVKLTDLYLISKDFDPFVTIGFTGALCQSISAKWFIKESLLYVCPSNRQYIKDERLC